MKKSKSTYTETEACSPRPRGKMKALTQINNDIAECTRRKQLATRIQRLLTKWEPILGVDVQSWRIQDMKTYWASVNERERRITFNLKLLDMAPAFVEVTVVHELVHFLTNGHDQKFHDLMDQHVPSWRKWHEQFAEKMEEQHS